MNLDGLTPEQLTFILNLNHRIKTLESKLICLQGKQVRIDLILTEELARAMKHLHLN